MPRSPSTPGGARAGSHPRVVLAHDWLTGMRGGERVLDALCELFPDAPLLTLVHVPGAVSARIEARRILTSPLNSLPGIARNYRRFLPLMPAAVAALRVPPCNLLLSSSHAVIKALRPPPGARHLCYLHAPMRYAWGQQAAYFGSGRTNRATQLAAALLMPALRRWDAATAPRVDRFVCNSHHVADQVRRHYRQPAAVVHPAVQLERFEVGPRPGPQLDPDAPYLMVSAFAPYKGIEVALEAFSRLGRRLEVIGDGQLYDQLRPRFTGAQRALGRLSDAEVAAAYARCRALVMPAEEDFGIAPLEAQASGRPVIALGKGGALETVRPLGTDRPTGVLYADTGRAVEDLMNAVLRFEASEARFAPLDARAQAERFSAQVFRAGIEREVEALLAQAPHST